MVAFPELASLYIEQHLIKRSSYRYYKRLFRQFFAEWTEHPTKFQIKAWHLAQEGTPAHSNKALGFLKAMYSWGQVTGDRTGQHALWPTENPAMGIKRHVTRSRNRVISDAELVRLLTYMDFTTLKLRTLLTVLITTGCRMSEARKMRWAHIDLDNKLWFKPTTKNGTPQTLPIPSQTVDALLAMPREGDYVFMGHYSRCLSSAGVEKAWGQFRQAANLDGVRLHDFRRTVGTRVYQQTRDEKIVRAILHHTHKTVTDIYIQIDHSPVALALQNYTDSIWNLQREGRANVPLTWRPSVPPASRESEWSA